MLIAAALPAERSLFGMNAARGTRAIFHVLDGLKAMVEVVDNSFVARHHANIFASKSAASKLSMAASNFSPLPKTPTASRTVHVIRPSGDTDYCTRA
jgi:hypothetical protein